MTSPRRQLLLSAFKLFDVGVMTLSFGLAALLVSHVASGASLANFLALRVTIRNILVFFLFCVLWHCVFTAFGLYQSRRLGGHKREVGEVLMAVCLGTLLVTLIALVWRVRFVTPLFTLFFFVLAACLASSGRILLRIVLRWTRRRGRNLREIVIVGTNAKAVAFARALEGRPELGYRLVGFVDQDWPGSAAFRASGYSLVADFDNFPPLLRHRVIDEVALMLPMKSLYPQASRVAALCEEQGVIVRQVLNLFDLRLAKVQPDELGPSAVATISASPMDAGSVPVKRVIDIVLSLAALALLAPVFLLAAAIVALDSPGPIFFSQERIGLNKRRFRMYKFRTMVADAEAKQAELESRNEVDGPVFKLKNDPRVTRSGRYLRKFSVDELPQLLNVLRGDMSLVGPRPLPVRDYEGFEQDRQRRRFSIRPGITCLWQINGRSEVPFDHWMDLDMQYIDHWSLWLDLKILAKTIPAVLRGTGAA